jgi:hypothetical protein
MQEMQQQQPQMPTNLEQLHRIAINLVEFVCSIITMPVEIIIRWQYGTRYFPIPVVFLSTMLMLFLPLFAATADSVSRMIPFHVVPPTPGMFGIGSFSGLYFFLSFLHGFRIWRRMIYMHLEEHSRWEGPPLPFLYLVPGSRSHWVTRIVIEPLFLFFGSILLEHAFIFQPGLATYIRVAAIALVFKNFIVWYRVWEFMRDQADMITQAPIVANLMQNKATDQDLAKIHVATFPKAPPDLRAGAASRIAQVFSPATSETNQPKEAL